MDISHSRGGNVSYSRRSSLGSSLASSWNEDVGCDADSVEPNVHGPHMADPQHGLASLDDLAGTPMGLGGAMLGHDGGLGDLGDLDGGRSGMDGPQGRHEASLIKSGDAASLEFKAGTTWRLAYQRNNKSKDQKNLRCFPNCCLGFGHQDGFCGQSIAVVLEYTPRAVNASALIACGEFAVDGSKPYPIGSLTTLDQINKHGAEDEAKKQFCYMKGHHIMLNKQQQEQERGHRGLKPRPGRAQSLFEFNRNLKGWHYGFLGSKKTRNMYHVFRAYVLERVHDGTGPGDLPKYKVLAVCQSPPWQMYCRRRKYNHIVQKKSRRVVGSSASEAAEAELQIQQQIDEEASKAAAAKAARRGGASGNGTGRGRASSAHAHLNVNGSARAEPLKRGRGTNGGTENSASLKRRPKAISIPAPLQVTTATSDRRRSSSVNENAAKAEGLDFGSISLEHQGSNDVDMQFASLQRGGAPLPNLSSPSGLYADLRFKRIVDLIGQLGLPQPLGPHKFSLSNSEMAQFSQSVCSFLVHWQELQYIWPPQYPYVVHEYNARLGDPSDDGADAVLDPYEHFALFLFQQESFRNELAIFIQNHPDGFKNADPYNVSVFALKLFTEFFQAFLNDRQYKQSRGLLNGPTLAAGGGGFGDAHIKDESDRSTTWTSPASDQAGAQHMQQLRQHAQQHAFMDIAMTPRGHNLNQEDFDILQASLQTPRGLSGAQNWANSGPVTLGGSFRLAGLSAAKAVESGIFSMGTHGGSSSSSISCSIPRELKPLSALTPKSSFAMSPKGSFLLSPKNSFSINTKFIGGESKVDFDMLNLPSPGFRSPRILAQVDSFLEDTKDYPSRASTLAATSPSSKEAFKSLMSRAHGNPAQQRLAHSSSTSS